ncbi:MAG: dUTP diphosphatase [Candidatus Pacearchaeota archaeon]
MSDSLKIYVEKIHKDAKAPTKEFPNDACWDLYATKDTKIPSSGSCEWVSTGIRLRLPKGYFARIYGRSGYSKSEKTMIGAGVIDEGYTGELKVLVFNFSAYPLVVTKGTKFAQMSLHRLIPTEVEEVKSIDDLGTTARGDKGFGSSGK